MPLLEDSAIYLLAAVVAVPLFRLLGFGSVLGYLAAGLVIGPWGLALVTDVDSILHFSEVGVVFLMFVVGLELQPSRLWALRRWVFGLGTAQVLVTGTALTLVALFAGLPVRAALVAGLGLALSSTAFVLQMLAEKGHLTTHHGRAAFAILLFQDLAVIPLLAALPLLAKKGLGLDLGWGAGLATFAWRLGFLAVLVAGGHYLLRPAFRLVAGVKVPEISTAAALLVVIGAALAVDSIGASMPLGAFIAGVLLADSEYRHELEANIEPFKGLLLGLFFMAVGMSANMGLIIDSPLRVIELTAALIALKWLAMFAVGKIARLPGGAPRQLAFTLAQGGEFGFVLFTAALSRGIIDRGTADLLILAVTLSMAVTPVLYLLNDRVVERLFARASKPEFDAIEPEGGRVIIAGFGRYGQIVGRLLRSQGIAFTALEASPAQVDVVRRYGNEIYYGDASRPELLRAAGADSATILVLAIDDVQASVETAETVRELFPNLTVYARARNRHHAHRLMDAGAKLITRELFFSSLRTGSEVLKALGFSKQRAEYAVDTFRRHDEATLEKQYSLRGDEAALIQSARDAAEELRSLFEADSGPDAEQPDRSRRDGAA